MTGIVAVMSAAGSVRVSLDSRTVGAIRVGATATAGFKLSNDGRIYTKKNTSAYADIGAWVTPSALALASLHEVNVTVVSGVLTSGTSGSWLALSSDQAWTLEASSFGAVQAVLTVEIRLASTSAIVATATITLEAEYV